ncbi:MAG: glycosyltransferase family 2 protein [Pseudomonadota bacterium]
MAEIAVIVVNYGSADLAIDAVSSVLERQHGDHMVHLHLVDNASPGADRDILQAAMARPGWAGHVTFYPEDTNHGFGRGNNVVIDRLIARPNAPDYVFLLNPDARLANETLAVLADFLNACPDAGVAGARIRKPGNVPVTAAFRFPGWISTFAAALSFGPVSRLTQRWQVALSPDLATGQVDWVAGAAVMLRLSALRTVGSFDPAYFLYYEEVDLMRRLGRSGWQTWYVAEAEAIHVEGASTGVKSGEHVRRRRPAYWYESWRIYFINNHGRAHALLACLGWMLGATLNLPLARLRGKTPAAPQRFFHDFWAMAVRPILGLAAKPYG